MNDEYMTPSLVSQCVVVILAGNRNSPELLRDFGHTSTLMI